MAFVGLNKPEATIKEEESVAVKTPHEQNLDKIAEYGKRIGIKPENMSHNFGGKKLDSLGRETPEFVSYSEFSKDPAKTAEFVKSFEGSTAAKPKTEPLSSEQLREANVTPNYYDDLNEIVSYYKDEGVGAFIADYADDLEEDKALYTAIQNVMPAKMKADTIEDTLSYLYNADPKVRDNIQKEYNRILSLRVGKKPEEIRRSSYGMDFGKLGDII